MIRQNRLLAATQSFCQQDMLENYLDILDSFYPLSPETRAELAAHISTRKVKRGELILEFGSVCDQIYFVDRGVIRIFYYKEGKEITEWLADEKQFFFSIVSYFEDRPSRLIIEAIEDCDIIQLSREGLESLRRSNLEVANLVIGFYSKSLILSQKRMESLQFESASKRYRNLLSEQPNLVGKVPLQHVASFLGITQETLSRIRASLKVD